MSKVGRVIDSLMNEDFEDYGFSMEGPVNNVEGELHNALHELALEPLPWDPNEDDLPRILTEEGWDVETRGNIVVVSLPPEEPGEYGSEAQLAQVDVPGWGRSLATYGWAPLFRFTDWQQCLSEGDNQFYIAPYSGDINFPADDNPELYSRLTNAGFVVANFEGI